MTWWVHLAGLAHTFPILLMLPPLGFRRPLSTANTAVVTLAKPGLDRFPMSPTAMASIWEIGQNYGTWKINVKYQRTFSSE